MTSVTQKPQVVVLDIDGTLPSSMINGSKKVAQELITVLQDIKDQWHKLVINTGRWLEQTKKFLGETAMELFDVLILEWWGNISDNKWNYYPETAKMNQKARTQSINFIKDLEEKNLKVDFISHFANNKASTIFCQDNDTLERIFINQDNKDGKIPTNRIYSIDDMIDNIQSAEPCQLVINVKNHDNVKDIVSELASRYPDLSITTNITADKSYINIASKGVDKYTGLEKALAILSNGETQYSMEDVVFAGDDDNDRAVFEKAEEQKIKTILVGDKLPEHEPWATHHVGHPDEFVASLVHMFSIAQHPDAQHKQLLNFAQQSLPIDYEQRARREMAAHKLPNDMSKTYPHFYTTLLDLGITSEHIEKRIKDHSDFLGTYAPIESLSGLKHIDKVLGEYFTYRKSSLKNILAEISLPLGKKTLSGEQIFLIWLLWHDYGKWLANQLKLWDMQKKFIKKEIVLLLQSFGITKQDDIDKIWSIVGIDPIGPYIMSKNRNPDASSDSSVQELQEGYRAWKNILSKKKYFDLIVGFYSCDSGSYVVPGGDPGNMDYIYKKNTTGKPFAENIQWLIDQLQQAFIDYNPSNDNSNPEQNEETVQSTISWDRIRAALAEISLVSEDKLMDKNTFESTISSIEAMIDQYEKSEKTKEDKSELQQTQSKYELQYMRNLILQLQIFYAMTTKTLTRHKGFEAHLKILADGGKGHVIPIYRGKCLHEVDRDITDNNEKYIKALLHAFPKYKNYLDPLIEKNKEYQNSEAYSIRFEQFMSETIAQYNSDKKRPEKLLHSDIEFYKNNFSEQYKENKEIIEAMSKSLPSTQTYPPL